MCAAALPPDAFFVIYAYNFTDTSGGITVLHFLADQLNRLYGALGPVAFVSNAQSTNPGFATPLLPPWRNASTGIAVYPEVVFGNPLKASRAIRWVLWFPGGNGGPGPEGYDHRDLVACYSPGLCTRFLGKQPAITTAPLRLIDYGLEYLSDLPAAQRRRGTITYKGKSRWWRQGSNRPPFERNYSLLGPEIPGARLDGSVGKRRRMEMFSGAEFFFSYDAGTWRSVEAALAGAKSVVLPVEGVSKEEWLQSIYGADELRYGVAYGLEDLPHALATQHLLLPMLKRRAMEQQRELRVFVAEACRFFNLSCTLEAC